MLNKIIFYLTAILLAFLPFHAIATTILKYGLGLDQIGHLGIIISTWKEIIIIVIAFLISLQFINNKTYKNKKILFNPIIINIFLFIFLGMISYIWAKPPGGIEQWIWGARYDFFFLITLIIFSFHNLSKIEVEKLVNITLYSGASSIILGLIIFIISPENLLFLGFRNDWNTWYANQALAACQKVENSTFCRLSGTFSGPNQYGTYLSIIIPIFVLKYKNTKSKKILTIIILALISLILSLSRSAWISLLIQTVIFLKLYYRESFKLITHLKKNWGKYIISSSIITILFFFIKNFKNQFPIVLRLIRDLSKPGSTLGHFKRGMLGLNMIKTNPFGLGLGTAGPASYRFENIGNPSIITENWYLQLAVELSIIGMLLFIGILYQIIWKALKVFVIDNKKDFDLDFVLGLALMGLATASIFLHSFEDSSMVLTLFTLIGLQKIIFKETKTTKQT